MVIYKIVNRINNKIYIGQDLYNNPSYFGSGILIKKAISKYGKDNFEKIILEYCEDPSMLNHREIFWIKELNSTDRKIGYNIHKGGDGGDTFSGKHHTEESKLKSKISNQKTWSNPELRKAHSENRKKIAHKVKPKVIEWWTEERRKERGELIKSKWTEEVKNSVSSKMKEIKKKKIICNDIPFDSITEAIEGTGLSYHLIMKNVKDDKKINWYICNGN